MRKSSFLFLAAVGGLVLGGSSLAHATSYNIATTAVTQAWDGACSLLEAMNASNTLAPDHECAAGTGDDQISLSGGTYTATTQLFVNRNLTISGSGLSIIAANFSATPPYDTFIVVYGNLTIDNVTVRNDTGSATVYTTGIGAFTGASITSNDRLRVTGFTWCGIYVENAMVTLVHARIDRNSNLYPDPNWNHGGGIWLNDWDPNFQSGLELHRSTIAFNTAGGDGGGLYFGANHGSHLTYTTFANNSAARGGGIHIATQQGGYFEARHVSIGANSATVSGGGIEEHHMGSGLTIESSIIANNSAPTGANLVRNATGGTANDNIWGTGVTSTLLGCNVAGWVCGHNTYGADAKFGPAMTMGGAYYSTEVLPLKKGSPAIDYGANAGAESTDQREMPGNQDGDNSGNASVDAGAFEKNLVWQSEHELQFASSSGDLVNIDVAGGYSGGLGRRLDPNVDASDDWVKFIIPIAEPGTYDITVKFKRASDGGRFKVGTASSLNGTYTEFAAEQDCYASSTTFPAAVSLGTRTFSAAQNYYVRFRITGQTAGSSGRILYQDYLKVRKTD